MENNEAYIKTLKNNFKTLSEIEMQLKTLPEVQKYISITRRMQEIAEELALLTQEDTMKR